LNRHCREGTLTRGRGGLENLALHNIGAEATRIFSKVGRFWRLPPGFSYHLQSNAQFSSVGLSWHNVFCANRVLSCKTRNTCATWKNFWILVAIKYFQVRGNIVPSESHAKLCTNVTTLSEWAESPLLRSLTLTNRLLKDVTKIPDPQVLLQSTSVAVHLLDRLLKISKQKYLQLHGFLELSDYESSYETSNKFDHLFVTSEDHRQVAWRNLHKDVVSLCISISFKNNKLRQ
jgi:hypothetical protein